MDPRIDAYIAKAAPFAQPLLKRIRTVIHSASPDIDETMKWSSPHFDYKGMVCGFAVFKEHIRFGFWKQDMVVGKSAGDTWGFGHIKTLKDLPTDAQIKKYVKKAMALNDSGVKATHMINRKKRPALPMPKDLKAAFAMNKKAQTHFEGFSPSAQREYIEWIVDAKSEDTRNRRVETTVEWSAEGKRRNWKYEKK